MSADSLPKILLKSRRAQPFYAQHPWVFAGATAQIPKNLETGSEVLVVSQEGKPIARGLYNAESQICVRLYSWQIDTPLDDNFWKTRIASAVRLRQQMFADDQTQACRVIFSESDGLSGLTVDRFGDWLSVQFTSQALAQRLDTICDALQETLNPKGIWLRTEKGMTAAEGLTVSDGLLRGEEPPQPLHITENGLKYRVDLVEGQKTGFYYDQRDNRLAAARYLSGKVLDVCSYSGGFAMNALKHGRADEVTCVDSSAGAMALAEENAGLNGLADRMRFETADALKFLDQTEERYNGIILDPPKFARSRGGLNRAAKAYRKWNMAAMHRLDGPGILVTCSCSGLITQEDFREILASAALEAGKTVRILEIRGQAPDHPVITSCPENAYLKCLICAVE